MSELAQERQMDYLFSYTAPVLLADDKGKAMLSGLRTERLTQALRLADVCHEILEGDILTRGRVVHPEKLQIDETAFSLG